MESSQLWHHENARNSIQSMCRFHSRRFDPADRDFQVHNFFSDFISTSCLCSVIEPRPSALPASLSSLMAERCDAAMLCLDPQRAASEGKACGIWGTCG